MKKIPLILRSVWPAGLVLVSLLCANVAAADNVTTESISVIDDWVGDLPAADLNGWFFSPDPELPFPAEPDPSQPWTSAANIVTMDYWLSIVEELGSDPSLLWQLYELGMIDSPNITPAQISQLIKSNSQVISQENPGNVPEPATWVLFCGGLALLVCCTGLSLLIRNKFTEPQTVKEGDRRP